MFSFNFPNFGFFFKINCILFPLQLQSWLTLESTAGLNGLYPRLFCAQWRYIIEVLRRTLSPCNGTYLICEGYETSRKGLKIPMFLLNQTGPVQNFGYFCRLCVLKLKWAWNLDSEWLISRTVLHWMLLFSLPHDKR